MPKSFALYVLLLTLIINSCDSPKVYTLEELEKNNYNDLQLEVKPALNREGFIQLFKELSPMNNEQLLTRLGSQDLELHVASFVFYYLANSYAASKDTPNAIKYHTIAAHQYINPQSQMKLAELNFFKEKNYAKAYEYLHQSLEVTVEITANNRSHPLAENGKTRAQNMLVELNRLSAKKKFDKEAIREKLKTELPMLLTKYRAIYGLGAREGENPS
jgi:ribosomal protein S8